MIGIHFIGHFVSDSNPDTLQEIKKAGFTRVRKKTVNRKCEGPYTWSK